MSELAVAKVIEAGAPPAEPLIVNRALIKPARLPPLEPEIRLIERAAPKARSSFRVLRHWREGLAVLAVLASEYGTYFALGALSIVSLVFVEGDGRRSASQKKKSDDENDVLPLRRKLGEPRASRVSRNAADVRGPTLSRGTSATRGPSTEPNQSVMPVPERLASGAEELVPGPIDLLRYAPGVRGQPRAMADDESESGSPRSRIYGITISGTPSRPMRSIGISMGPAAGISAPPALTVEQQRLLDAQRREIAKAARGTDPTSEEATRNAGGSLATPRLNREGQATLEFRIHGRSRFREGPSDLDPAVFQSLVTLATIVATARARDAQDPSLRIYANIHWGRVPRALIEQIIDNGWHRNVDQKPEPQQQISGAITASQTPENIRSQAISALDEDTRATVVRLYQEQAAAATAGDLRPPPSIARIAQEAHVSLAQAQILIEEFLNRALDVGPPRPAPLSALDQLAILSDFERRVNEGGREAWLRGIAEYGLSEDDPIEWVRQMESILARAVDEEARRRLGDPRMLEYHDEQCRELRVLAQELRNAPEWLATLLHAMLEGTRPADGLIYADLRRGVIHIISEPMGIALPVQRTERGDMARSFTRLRQLGVSYALSGHFVRRQYGLNARNARDLERIAEIGERNFQSQQQAARARAEDQRNRLALPDPAQPAQPPPKPAELTDDQVAALEAERAITRRREQQERRAALAEERRVAEAARQRFRGDTSFPDIPEARAEEAVQLLMRVTTLGRARALEAIADLRSPRLRNVTCDRIVEFINGTYQRRLEVTRIFVAQLVELLQTAPAPTSAEPATPPGNGDDVGVVPAEPRDWSHGDWSAIGSFGNRARLDLNRLMLLPTEEERLATAIATWGEKDGRRLLRELDKLSRAQNPGDVRAELMTPGNAALRKGFEYLHEGRYYRIPAVSRRFRIVFRWVPSASGQHFLDVDFVDYHLH